MSAGWAAAFVSGALGFFQAASSRAADRRLALAGTGPARVAGSRIVAAVLLAMVAAAAAFTALVVRVDVAHPLHAAIAVLAFALLYLAYAFPDYGAGRVIIDGAFSAGFHAWGELALALAWTAALAIAVAWVLRRLLGGAA